MTHGEIFDSFPLLLIQLFPEKEVAGMNELANLKDRPCQERRIEKQLDRILEALDRLEVAINNLRDRPEKMKTWGLLLRGKSKKGGDDAQQGAIDR